MTRLKQPTSEKRAMKEPVRTVTINGATFKEDAILRAVKFHTPLVDALKEARFAISNHGTVLQMDALQAIETVLTKVKRATI